MIVQMITGQVRESFNPRTHTGCDIVRHTSVPIDTPSFNPRTHTGCDRRASLGERFQDGFNPRTHTGCDVRKWKDASRSCAFQSTHPHGVRRGRGLSVCIPKAFQSTHPHGVRLPSGTGTIPSSPSFNPRTHTGCDTGWHCGYAPPTCFNPRTHTGCDMRGMPH